LVCEFTTGGEAHDPEARRGYVPFVRTAADEAKSALGIGKSVDLDLVGGIGLAGEAMLQHESRDTALTQPFSHVVSLVSHDKHTVATTGNNKYGGTRSFIFGW